MTLPDADPAAIGLDPDRIDLIRRRANEWIEAGDVHRTLVLLIARHGQVGFHEAFGVDGPEPDAASLRTDAVFPLFSQTKSITAALVMTLVEDGLVGLSRPVQEYLPEFVGERKDEVLVQHLLTHTSGLADNDFVFNYARLGPQLAAGLTPDPLAHPYEQVLLELAYTWPVAHDPGQAMRYSSLGFLLLGEIVRRVSGQTLDAFARARVFDPLGMHDTWLCAPPSSEVGRLVRRSHDQFPLVFDLEDHRGSLGGAGGAFSTALDVARFVQMFLDGGRNRAGEVVLRPSSIQRMTTDQIPGLTAEVFDRHTEASSGFGWLIQAPRGVLERWPMPPDGSLQHAGLAYVHPWADPSHDLVGVFMSVADRLTASPSGPLDLANHADLFVSMVTASTSD